MGKQAGSVLADIINVPHTKAHQVIISPNMENNVWQLLQHVILTLKDRKLKL